MRTTAEKIMSKYIPASKAEAIADINVDEWDGYFITLNEGWNAYGNEAHNCRTIHADDITELRWHITRIGRENDAEMLRKYWHMEPETTAAEETAKASSAENKEENTMTTPKTAATLAVIAHIENARNDFWTVFRTVTLDTGLTQFRPAFIGDSEAECEDYCEAEGLHGYGIWGAYRDLIDAKPAAEGFWHRLIADEADTFDSVIIHVENSNNDLWMVVTAETEGEVFQSRLCSDCWNYCFKHALTPDLLYSSCRDAEEAVCEALAEILPARNLTAEDRGRVALDICDQVDDDTDQDTMVHMIIRSMERPVIVKESDIRDIAHRCAEIREAGYFTAAEINELITFSRDDIAELDDRHLKELDGELESAMRFEFAISQYDIRLMLDTRSEWVWQEMRARVRQERAERTA